MNGGDNREGSSGTIRSVIIANGAELYPAYTGNRALYGNVTHKGLCVDYIRHFEFYKQVRQRQITHCMVSLWEKY